MIDKHGGEICLIKKYFDIIVSYFFCEGIRANSIIIC